MFLFRYFINNRCEPRKFQENRQYNDFIVVALIFLFMAEQNWRLETTKHLFNTNSNITNYLVE